MSATASSSRSTRTRGGASGEDVGSGGTDEKQEGVEQYEEEWDAWSANDDDESAEPVKKKARKATQSKGKGKSKVSKKNEGKLAPLLDLPVEIFTEVAGHLDPLTLLHLSRTSKAFHQLFASRSSKGIWQAARSTVDLPDLEADDLTEMAYAAFMFEKVCSVCEKDRAGIVNFDLRLRFCKGCQKANLNPEHYFSIVFPNLVVHPRTLECCLRTQKSHNPNGFDWYFMPEVFAVNEALFNVQAAIDDEDELPEVRESLAAEMAEFIAKRKARVTASQSDARILEDLASASAIEREKAVQEAKRQRREAIIAKLEELGYDKRDLDVWDPAVRKIVVQARPLTDLSWQRMSSDLIQHVEKNRDLRLAYEKTTRRFQAQFTLGPYYNSMLAAQTSIDDGASLPPLAEFIYLPAVAQFWLDDPPAELNDESWKEAGPAILREVKVEKERLEAAEDID